MIRVEKIGLIYERPSTTPLEVLTDLALDIKKDEVVSIIGPSGCGKTSFLNLLAGLMKPTYGQIYVNGSTAEKALKDRLLSYVLQRPVLFPWRNIIQNVLLPMEMMDKEELKRFGDIDWYEKAFQLLKLLELEEVENFFPIQLSGGMQARVALARAYLTSPQILLMDEPFASLDLITRDKMNMELLKIKEKRKSTIIFVTHSIEEAVFISDRILVMSPLPGRIKSIIDIDLPPKRSLGLRDTIEFRHFAKILREELEETQNGN